MDFKFFSKSEKNKIILSLGSQFGVEKIKDNWRFFRLGKERIKIFTGSFSEEEIFELRNLTRIEGLGLYFAKEVENFKKKEFSLRLSIEGSQLLGNLKEIRRNVFELTNNQKDEWVFGNDIILSEEEKKKIGDSGFKIIKFQDNFLGTGKLTEVKDRLVNYVGKSRRVKMKE